MSYASHLGQIYIPTSAFVTTPVADPNAWRTTWKAKMVAIANKAAALAAVISSPAQKEALTNLARTYLTRAIATAGTATKEETRFWLAFAQLPSALSNPTGLNSTQLTSLRVAVAPLKQQIDELKLLANPPAAPPPPPPATVTPTFSILPSATAPRVTTVMPTTPPPVSAAQPEVECTDGYVRDAAGLCQPGAAAPGPAVAPDMPPVTMPAPPPGMMIDGSGTPVTTSTTAPAAASAGPLGVSLKWWAAGAIGVTVVGALLMSSKKVSPNRRRHRRVRRNTGFLTSGARVKKRGSLGGASGSIVEVHGGRASVRWDSGGRPEWVDRSSITRA